MTTTTPLPTIEETPGLYRLQRTSHIVRTFPVDGNLKLLPTSAFGPGPLTIQTTGIDNRVLSKGTLVLFLECPFQDDLIESWRVLYEEHVWTLFVSKKLAPEDRPERVESK